MNHKSIQILRTRLNNTDTKIANEVLLDGQPLYNKTSNKLYVGDGTKKISELKYIGQEAWEDFNIENGTGAVLIQTKDQNHSFKVMTDGRAKVQSAPIESNDVVRKLELDKKLDKTVVVQTTGNSTTDVMSQKAVTENFVNTHSEVEVGNSANITNKDGILQLSTDGFNGKSYLMSDENGYLKFLHTDLQGNTLNLITTDDYYLHFAKGSFDFDQGTQTILEGDVVFSNTIPLFNNGLQIQIGEAITYGTSDGGNKDVYAPSESGRTAIEPNSNPTETSLVTVSSTGTHAYKKVSEVVDTKSEQTLTGTKTWKVNEPGITKTLAVSASSVYSKTDYSDGTRQSATFFSGGINLNKSTESNPIGDYTSIGFPYLVNHTDDVYKLALAPDVVPTEPSIIVNATDRHVTWKPLSELEVSVPTRSQVDLLF